MTAVIVAGSGYSLRATPIEDLGLPICAVSTAIRWIKRPRYWVLVDNINSHHLLKKGEPGIGGTEALKDPSVEVVIPSLRLKSFGGATHVTVCKRVSPNDPAAIRRKPKEIPRRPRDRNRGQVVKGAEFLDDGDYCIRTFNRSMLFAVEWLMKFGKYDTLLFVGVDLREAPDRKYDPQRKRKTASKDHNHMREFGVWEEWAPVAKAKGYRWLCWCPGSILETIMEKYDGTERLSEGDGVVDREPPAVRPEGSDRIDAQVAQVEPPAPTEGVDDDEVPGAGGESQEERGPGADRVKPTVVHAHGLAAAEVQPFFKDLEYYAGERACTLPNHTPRQNMELAEKQAHFLFRTCRLAPREPVLDYGCGSAKHAKRFKGRYIGVDVVPAMIARAKRLNPRKTFILLDDPWLPTDFPGRFRMFFTCTVFQNNNDELVRHVLHSVARCQGRSKQLELCLYEIVTHRDQTAYVAGRTHEEYLSFVEEFFTVAAHGSTEHRPTEAVYALHRFRVV